MDEAARDVSPTSGACAIGGRLTKVIREQVNDCTDLKADQLLADQAQSSALPSIQTTTEPSQLGAEKGKSASSSCELLRAEPVESSSSTVNIVELEADKVLGQSRGTGERDRFAQQQAWFKRTRLRVTLLGLAIAVANCYAQATFCIAIVEMVLPADLVQVTPETASKIDSISFSSGSKAVASLDESCPIEFRYKSFYDEWRFVKQNDTFLTGSVGMSSEKRSSAHDNSSNSTSQSISLDLSNRFDWDASQQGLLLGAFAFGTAPLQILGGRLAEIYGAKWVLLAGCLGTALTNLTIPMIARTSFVLLLANRVLMGVSQAGMEPGVMCLLADWLPPDEAGFFISMSLFALCFGFFLGSLLSSFILALGFGWPLAYYVSGGLNLLVGLVWLWYADSWPHASRRISNDELSFIEARQGRHLRPERQAPLDVEPLKSPEFASTEKCSGACQEQKEARVEGQLVEPVSTKEHRSSGAPWATILTTRSVWAFIICKISIRWCADVISNELPTYLANVLHLSIEINGLLNSVSSALFAICSFLTGWLVNELSRRQEARQRQQVDKTNMRKLFQSSANFGSALTVFLMTSYDCNLFFSTTMLLILSCVVVVGAGGELQIPYDMTSRYPGTLHGMACTLSVSGWLAPPLIGLILGDRPASRQRWRIVWYLTASICLIGGLVFVLFADASPRDFDEVIKKRSKKRTGEKNNSTNAGAHGWHTNEACSPGSTCNNSPKLAAQQQHVLKQQENINSCQPQSGLYFDEKLIKIRQSSEALVVPGSYPAHSSFSSLANFELVFPYQPGKAGNPRDQQVGSRDEQSIDTRETKTLLSRLKRLRSLLRGAKSLKDAPVEKNLDAAVTNESLSSIEPNATDPLYEIRLHGLEAGVKSGEQISDDIKTITHL